MKVVRVKRVCGKIKERRSFRITLGVEKLGFSAVINFGLKMFGLSTVKRMKKGFLMEMQGLKVDEDSW